MFNFIILPYFFFLTCTGISRQKCGYEGFDLSPLIKHPNTGIADWEWSEGKNTWWINPCSNTIHTCEAQIPKKSPAIMNYNYKTPLSCYDLAKTVNYEDKNTMGEWSLISNGITVIYNDGDDCYLPNITSLYSISMEFICHSHSGKLVQVTQNGCQSTAHFITKYACSGKGVNFYSWLFVCIFVSGFLIYCVGGCVWNKKHNKLEGCEIIPNLKIWTSLPGLCIDGFCFSITLLRKLFSFCGLCRRSSPNYDSLVQPISYTPKSYPDSYPPPLDSPYSYGTYDT